MSGDAVNGTDGITAQSRLLFRINKREKVYGTQCAGFFYYPDCLFFLLHAAADISITPAINDINIPIPGIIPVW